MAEMQIRDAIHTRLALSDGERRVLDHRLVQRLRHIRQLGFVPLVYPSATHDRLSHSLGTMHVAGLLARQLTENESSSAIARILKPAEKKFFIRILRLAGLLHDIGHAPFSHSAELIMPPISSLAIPHSWMRSLREDRLATHEDYTVLMIAGMAEGPDAVLTPTEAEIISSLVHHKKIKSPRSWNSFFSSRINAPGLHALAATLISSNIDADRMDYLLRDSHFTGVPYGHFDLDWLISNLGVITRNNEYILSMPETSILALEHYLFARYHMYAQVYMHKTAKCFEYYFQQALKEGEIPYAIPAGREAFAGLRDSTLTEHIFRAASQNPDSWSGLLVRRIPARRIARIWDSPRDAERIFARIRRDLKTHGVEPFLCVSQKKFLDLPAPRSQTTRGAQGAFLFDLAAIPIAIIRDQFDIRSAVSLADHSFILKQYRRDLSIADIYIPRSQYDKKKAVIRKVVKQYRTGLPDEVILDE